MRIINRIYAKESQVHNIINSRTVSTLAALPFICVEDLRVCGGPAHIIARLHPNCEHPTNDPEVFLRALAFMPDEKIDDRIEESQIYRVTIRQKYLDLDSSYVKEALSIFRGRDWELDQEYATARVADYHRLAQALLDAPVVDLSDPWRARWEQWSVR